MSKPDAQAENAASKAATELVSLQRQAAGLRVELAALRKAIGEGKLSLGSIRAGLDLQEANEKLVVAALRAQTESEASARALDEVSRSHDVDALTGLPNRNVFFDRLVRASAETRANGQRLAVLFIDLNGFKHVNDAHGHAAGDYVLKQAAQRLVALARPSDTVSRWGGDEFVVLLADTSHSAAAITASRIVEGLTFPVHIGENELWLTASIGGSIYPDDADDADDVRFLVDRADAAMYRAKRRGHGNGGYAFHDNDALAAGYPRAGTDLILKRASGPDLATIHPARYLDLKEANEQLVIAAIGEQELRAAAEKALRRQHEFVAVVAHELRNPLSPILAAAQLLCHAGINEPSASRAQAIIERQVAQMSRLVNDLLDMSRLTTGRFTLEKAPVDLIGIVETAVENCAHLVRARFQALNVSTPQSVMIDGDAARLAQVLSNLLDNASKYTPQGGMINLELKVDEKRVVVTLSDTGIGITAEALPHIFDPFLQDTHAITFNETGLGIGLTVVRELVQAHGGTVTAQSAGRGAGSRFIVILPLPYRW